MKKISVLFILLGNSICIHSQGAYLPFSSMSLGSSKDFTPPSPGAASLGIYGQIPVGNYTGVAEINIPLYNLKYKELSVPISLAYHASGNKPELFPGPVGLGWTIQAGGCITRVVKGNTDFQPLEIYNANLIFWGYDLRAHPEWYSTKILNEYLYKPFSTTYNSMDPDIFYFNFNGFSGKFHIDETNTFQVQSSQGHSFKISINNYNLFPEKVDISSFTMIDENGIVYKFNQRELTQHYALDKKFLKDSDDNLLIFPTAWYLTSMESPNGYKISFKYNTHNQLIRNRFADVALYKLPSSKDTVSATNFRHLDSEKVMQITGAYIDRITTPNGFVSFGTTSANLQLNYEQTNKTDVETSLFPLKMSMMSVFNNKNDLLKEIIFNYTNDESTRLKLLGLNITDEQNTSLKYIFEYNPLSLPDYFSWATDLYGYYNGLFLFDGMKSETFISLMLKNPKYFNAMKSPDENSAQAEILKKITYPTGGYTEFQYEPHFYSSVYDIPNCKTVDQNKNLETAGVRIKKVSSYDSNGSIIDEDIYHYSKDYVNGGGISSGVLTYQPKFIESYGWCEIWQTPTHTMNLDMLFHWSTNPVFPLMNTSGNHVTYSEVTVQKLSGYITYKYKNYDNGYPDQKFLNTLYCKVKSGGFYIDPTENDEHTSMDIERGQLTSKSIYNINKLLKKEIIYTYNDDPNRFKKHVKFLRYVPMIFQQVSGHNCYKMEAGYIYTYFPYLKSKVETEYLDKPISRKTSYIYDDQYNLIKEERTENVDNQSLVTTYTYPHEESSGSVIDSMLQRRMLAYPVKEERKYKSGTYSLTNKYDIGLSDQNPSLIALKEVSLKTNGRGTYPEVIYSKYDSIGNPLQLESLSEGNICYIWSYNKEYPVAKIKGATFLEVKNILTEEYLSALGAQSYPTDEDISELRSKLSPLNALVTTYTYSPMVGKTSETSPNGITTTFQYDKNGRLITIKDHQGHTIKSHDYHYQVQ